MAPDPIARRVITSDLNGSYARLLFEAQRIASHMNAYVEALSRGPENSRTYAGDAVRIAAYLTAHAQDAARYDGAYDIARTLGAIEGAEEN